jgi:hypothetical protein
MHVVMWMHSRVKMMLISINFSSHVTAQVVANK